MSEIMNSNPRNQIRWHLLATVSLMTLLPIAGTAQASDDDKDRPTVWVDLGGQLERQTGQGDPYAPPFVLNYPSSPAYNPESPQQFDKPPLFSKGVNGKLEFLPNGSDWAFSASVQYGRANGRKAVNQLAPNHQKHSTLLYATKPPSQYYYVIHCCTEHIYTPTNGEFAKADIAHKDSHVILDFQAGKDVGLGLFGRNTTSNFSAGVRFAQFSTKASVVLHARPDFGNIDDTPRFIRVFYPQYPQIYYQGTKFHTFGGTYEATRSFHGVGPEISWNASVSLLSIAQDAGLSLDWGVNAAVLFGRRKAKGQHQETGHYVSHYPPRSYYTRTAHFDRSRSAIVPNVGGFAGLSYKLPNAKISLGYRGDFFFNAMDVGLDAEKTKTVGFYGPFATISIGLGG